MKWIAALLIIAGIMSVLWAMKQEPGTDLRDLPFVIIAGIAGAGMTIIGSLWMLWIVFASVT